jgi:GT2 family glycosyltransferase
MISVTLPSLYPEVLVTCLDNLLWAARGDIEVIVVAPFDAGSINWRFAKPGSIVVWVREHERRGIAAAHAVAAEHATGDYLFPWADDHLMMDGWDEAAVAEHEEGRKRASVFSLGMRAVAPHDKVELMFGKYVPCWPLMLRRDVEKVGGWLNGGFRAGYSDADLGLRVWEAGGRCEWSKVRPVRPTQNNVRPGQWQAGALADALRADLDLLCSRHEEVARGWPTHDASLCNVSINPKEADGGSGPARDF